MRLGVPLTAPGEEPAAPARTRLNIRSLPHRETKDKRRTLARLLPAVAWPVFAAVLSFVVWQPFVRLDFDLWRTDDGEYHLLRVYVFERAARAGEWLPRWTPDLFVGYGYPIFNFYAPGTYYLAMLLRLFGWDVYTTVQALGALAACVGAAGAYCLGASIFGGGVLPGRAARRGLGVLPGMVAALAFVYAPYPFVTNLLIRADLAEALGLALLPWAMLAAWRAGTRPGTGAGAGLALGMGAVVLTHNLTALVALPAAAVVGLFAAWHSRPLGGTAEAPASTARTGADTASLTRRRSWLRPTPRPDVPKDANDATGAALPPAGVARLWRSGVATVLAGLALALALTAFFWLPALLEQRHVQIEVALDGSHKSPRAWLIDPLGATEQTRRGGNPQTVSGPLDLHLSYPYDLNFPPKPSLGQGLLAAVTLALLLAGIARGRGGAARRDVRAPALLFGGGTILLWILTTTWSAWAWEHVPLMRFLQFSWRLYGPLALALALAAAGAAAVWLAPDDRALERAVPAAGSATAPAPAGSVAPEKGPPEKGPPEKSPLGMGTFRLAPLIAGVPLLAAVLLAANTTTARPLWLDPLVERRVSGPQLVGTENATFGAGTTTGGEFVPRSADLEALGPGKRRGNGVYERLYPEFGWLAGRTRVLSGRLRVVALAAGPTWTEATVDADTPGVLAFRTIAFPGWRAYVDGREVQAELAPWDGPLEVSPGFLTVPVPAGQHRVQIAFTPTRLRTLAGAVSVAALAVLGWWLVRPGRGAALASGVWPAPWPRPRPGAALAPAVALLPAALLALSCTHDAIRPALGAPAVPRPADERLVADILEQARAGTATTASPSGGGLGTFVDLRHLTIGAYQRRWLYMHPPAGLSASLVLPERAAFQAGLALDPRTWLAEGADGVRFILDVTPAGGETVRVLDEHVNPRAREEQRAWLDRWIDLSAFGGRRVTLTLRTEGAQTPDFDWAGWADPVVIIQGEARRPGGGPPAPLPTPRAS